MRLLFVRSGLIKEAVNFASFIKMLKNTRQMRVPSRLGLLIVILLFIDSNSWAQTTNEKILGAWVVDSVAVKLPVGMPEGPFKKEDIIGQVYTFNADSTFSVKFPNDELRNGGGYSIIDAKPNKQLVFQNKAQGITTSGDLLELDKSHLSFSMDFGEFVFYFYLKRQ